MKIIIDKDLAAVENATVIDNVTSIAASSEDANFPATNLRNDYATDLWRAADGVLVATIALNVSKGSAIMVYNTNAISIAVSVGVFASYELETGHSLEAGYSLETHPDPVTAVYSLPGRNGRLWADYTEILTPHTVHLVLTANETVKAGIIRAGVVEEFKDPQYGLDEGSVDYSVEEELNNGAEYSKKGNVVRTFSNLQSVELRADCHTFKHDIFDAVGPKPVAIRLVHNNITDSEYILFAKRMETPRIVHDAGPTRSRIIYSLKEVV